MTISKVIFLLIVSSSLDISSNNKQTKRLYKDVLFLFSENDDGSSAGKLNDLETVYKYEEHYFIPDPDDLINTHFPDEQAWQLLQQPLMLAQFQVTLITIISGCCKHLGIPVSKRSFKRFRFSALQIYHNKAQRNAYFVR